MKKTNELEQKNIELKKKNKELNIEMAKLDIENTELLRTNGKLESYLRIRETRERKEINYKVKGIVETQEMEKMCYNCKNEGKYPDCFEKKTDCKYAKNLTQCKNYISVCDIYDDAKIIVNKPLRNQDKMKKNTLHITSILRTENRLNFYVEGDIYNDEKT
jgi:hypothetical protein